MLRLKIISPQSVVFDGDVEQVTVPGTRGEFEILTNHAPNNCVEQFYRHDISTTNNYRNVYIYRT